VATPYVDDPDFTLWHGDVREVLPRLPAESVDCAVTSPPFYGLRDYGVTGQIGLEATPDEWAANLVAVFREVRRVLKPEGVFWLEVGDSYARGRSGRADDGLTSTGRESGWNATVAIGSKDRALAAGMKEKDLLGQPWLLAFALRDDGWYLRQCVIWHKPNAMPESVRDRCTTAHSYVFLLSKNARYWFDSDALAEPAEWARWGDQTTPKYEGTDTASGWMQPKSKQELTGENRPVGRGDTYSGFNALWEERLANGDGPRTKNARSVWSIPTSGFSEAHFATFPEALVERMLLAGCPEWTCLVCGKARERVSEVSYGKSPKHGTGSTIRKRNEDTDTNGWAGETMPRLAKHSETVGWSDCGCNAGFVPGTVLDPFMGSGTTALVARKLGRKAAGVELNESYCEMAARRLQQLSLLA
jgi:DNA modification methylase